MSRISEAKSKEAFCMMYQVIAKACTSCLQTGIKYPDGDEAVGTIKIASFLQSSMYLLLQRAASDKTVKFTENDWKLVEPLLENVFPEFVTCLYELYPQLSIIELRICWLTKLSFSPAEIARILLRSKQAISMARSRLYKKFYKKEGSGEKFDEFVKNLS